MAKKHTQNMGPQSSDEPAAEQAISDVPSILRPIKPPRPSTPRAKAASTVVTTSTALQTAPTNSMTVPTEDQPPSDDDQPTAVIAPADYENYFTVNRKLKQKVGSSDALKTVPSDSGPTALIAPADYTNYFVSQNRQRKKVASPAKTTTKFDDEDLPTALLQMNEFPPAPVRSKVKQRPSFFCKKASKVTSDMPTVMLAKDYENFFSKQKVGKGRSPKVAKTATRAIQSSTAVQSDCPTALVAPDDYQNLYANYERRATAAAVVSEAVPASIIELLKPKEARRSVRPARLTRQTATSPSTTVSPTTTPSPARRVSPLPLTKQSPSTGNDAPPEEQYYQEEPTYYYEEVVLPQRGKKKRKARRKCCCCCCC